MKPRKPHPDERALELDVECRGRVTRSATTVERVENLRAAAAVLAAVEKANAMLRPDLAEMMRGRA